MKLEKSSNPKHTLLIGGGGFIGLHLALCLKQSGRQVTLLGRHSRLQEVLPQEIRYISGDYMRADVINPLLDTHDEVVHLAYATVPNTSFENPLADLTQNLPSSVFLFEQIAKRGTRLLLVSSGGTVYGEAQSIPIMETHPTRPISPYGVTKLTLEHYASLYATTHGLNYVCVRPGNAYGEGQKPYTGQGFIATALAQGLKGKPVQLYGAQGVVRDYLHVSDMAKGMYLALELGQKCETYNIGSGKGISSLQILEFIRPLLSELGLNLQIEYLSARVFDVKANVLDSSLLKNDTGWQPEIDIETGLRRTRDWLRLQYAV